MTKLEDSYGGTLLSSAKQAQKEEVAGSATYINKVKQYATMLSFKVSLFVPFIQSWKQREFDYLVCLSR